VVVNGGIIRSIKCRNNVDLRNGPFSDMKLGIISDSHGHVRIVREALKILKSAGVQGIIHCGDLGGLEVLDELAGEPCWFVWGNTDFPQQAWRPHLKLLGLSWPTVPVEIGFDGKRIAVFHGHEREFTQAVKLAKYDYLFHGHTHVPEEHRIGKMRIISPGALHRVRDKTVATLDTASDDLEFIRVPDIHR